MRAGTLADGGCNFTGACGRRNQTSRMQEDTVVNQTDANPTLSITTDSSQTTDGNLEQRSTNIFLLPVLVLVVLFTCVSNIMVMLCTRLDVSLRLVAVNRYIFSLSCADLLVGILVMPAMALYTYTGQWPLGNATCTAWICLDYTCCSISVFHLCLIAYDRYQATRNPFRYKRVHIQNKGRWISVSLWLMWIVIPSFWLPAIIYYRSTSKTDSSDCAMATHPSFVIVATVCMFYIPSVLMSFFSIMCMKSAHEQLRIATVKDDEQLAPNERRNLEHRSPVSIFHVQVAPERNRLEMLTELKRTRAPPAEGQALRRRMEKIRSVRTLGVIIFIFLICWLPWFFYWPISTFCENCESYNWYIYSYWSAYINSCINPVLYFLCNKDFRRAFASIARRMGCVA